jgi:hypothetical protein
MTATEDPFIYFIDQVTPRPGQGELFYRHYMETYVPAAQARGLTLQHTWVNPPMWLEGEQSNTLFMVWSVKGTSGFWGVMARPESLDGSTGAWWRDAQPMIATRSRSVLSDAANLAVLHDV